MTTLEQLRRRYDSPCLPLAAVRADWLPHITTDKHLLAQIRSGRIALRYTRLHSQRGLAVVYLDDLARWLDSCNPSNCNTQPAANQAA